MDKKKILIVDDEAETRNSLSLALEWQGYETYTAENGRIALQFILHMQQSETPVDFVICDIQMPVMTGEELIQSLNEMDIELPVIAISGYGEKDLIVRLMKNRCCDFVDKPFDPEEIIDRVKNILANETRSLKFIRKNRHICQVVHDVKNVLAGISGYAELAGVTIPETSSSRKYLSKVMNATTRAAEICNSLLKGAHCNDSQEMVVSEINAIVARAAAILHDAIPESIKIETKTTSSPLWSAVNSSRLQQALLNLGFNAAQAMPDGGHLILESESAETAAGNVIRFLVRDTGIGISKETAANIFKYAVTTKATGHGIGLRTVKEIVDEHHGIIRIDSIPGEGSTVTIEIPLVYTPFNKNIPELSE